MKILEPLFVKYLKQLIESKVDFLLIGGYAVNYYGYGRGTGDIDFWLRPTNENKIALLDAFKKLGRAEEDLIEINKLDFTKAQVLFVGKEPVRMDFLTKVNIVNFDEAWGKRKYWLVENLQVPLVDYDHLILTKFATGRTKDKQDLEELQKINKHKKKK